MAGNGGVKKRKAGEEYSLYGSYHLIFFPSLFYCRSSQSIQQGKGKNGQDDGKEKEGPETWWEGGPLVSTKEH